MFFFLKLLFSLQFCKLLFPSPAYTPQIYCHLLNSKTDLLFNRSNFIFTNSLSETGLLIYILPGPTFFTPAYSMLLSAILQEPCCCLPSFLFCLSTSTHYAPFCDTHTHTHTLSFFKTHFFLSGSKMLTRCGPIADICTQASSVTLWETTAHVNTSVTRCCLEPVAVSSEPTLEGFQTHAHSHKHSTEDNVR